MWLFSVHDHQGGTCRESPFAGTTKTLGASAWVSLWYSGCCFPPRGMMSCVITAAALAIFSLQTPAVSTVLHRQYAQVRLQWRWECSSAQSLVPHNAMLNQFVYM